MHCSWFAACSRCSSGRWVKKSCTYSSPTRRGHQAPAEVSSITDSFGDGSVSTKIAQRKQRHGIWELNLRGCFTWMYKNLLRNHWECSQSAHKLWVITIYSHGSSVYHCPSQLKRDTPDWLQISFCPQTQTLSELSLQINSATLCGVLTILIYINNETTFWCSHPETVKILIKGHF